MLESISDYFTDSILRGPTIGSMLMCLASSIVGVIVFLRKESLLGESLSHAAYPGVLAGAALCGLLAVEETNENWMPWIIMGGAFIAAAMGLLAIQALRQKLKVPADAALCFVLSSFFGVGATLASRLQFSFPKLYSQAQVYLFGQAATMTDFHIWVYSVLAGVILLVAALFYKEIQAVTFDREYANTSGIKTGLVQVVIYLLVVMALVVGIRSVGVVLMTAMLIGPAASARQFTNRMSTMFAVAGCFGTASGFLGNYLSVELTEYIASINPAARISLPTGPMIVLVAAAFCILSLLLAPKRGVLSKIAARKSKMNRIQDSSFVNPACQINEDHMRV